ncbi:MAG TPA: translation initiation factor IF-2 associated domain-containing protein, partial [Aestuariivirga sp.]|nr:translation initiation factor IF-2 associated domain-containing protein [Aestuariivirga sp.]
MNDNNDKTETKRAGGGTLTLKRPTTEQSKVKQSFSHGRTKTVVVETKRKRFGEDKPAATEAKQVFQVQPKVAAPAAAPPRATQASRSGVVLRTLTDDEKEARDRALVGSRVREAEERKQQEIEALRRKEHEEKDARDREAAAKRKAEDDARHRAEEEGRRKAEEAAKKLNPKSLQQADREDEAEARSKGIRGSAGVIKRKIEVPAPTRTKADMDKRRGRLTVANALSDDEERNRSVAA